MIVDNHCHVTLKDEEAINNMKDNIMIVSATNINDFGPTIDLCEKYNALRTVPDLEAVFLELTGVEL